MTVKEQYQESIKNLIEKWEKLSSILTNNYTISVFRDEYEIRYSEAQHLVKTILPSRYEDFINYYVWLWLKDGNGIRTLISIHISRDMMEYNGYANHIKIQFSNQLAIIKACQNKFESSIYEIRYLTQAEIFDSTVEQAKELLKNWYTRAAWVIVWVVLEQHLKNYCTNKWLPFPKEKGTLWDIMTFMDKSELINKIDYRFLQRLNEIRIICSHDKQEEPEVEKVQELIDGTDKIIRNLVP